MLTSNDFAKKQLVFIFAKDGEKLCLLNGNLTVRDKDDKIKLQVSCYRLFFICIVGQTSVTTALIRESKKFGFYIVLMSDAFRMNAIIGPAKDANTALRAAQYRYDRLDVARLLVQNKITEQYENLLTVRHRSEYAQESMAMLKEYCRKAGSAENRQQLMAYEGLSSKRYFTAHFNNVVWNGRQPRVKRDWINSALDIGYTVLFSYMEALLSAFGFDLYKGFLHTQFYMRKSLVCDMVEPFRPLIDRAIKKAINLGQIKEEDFRLVDHKYQLEWKRSPAYTRIMLEAILEHKELIFDYVQQFYRCFMKGADVSAYPFVYKGEITHGPDQL